MSVDQPKDRRAKRRFLRSLSELLVIDSACKALKIKRQKVEGWRRADAQFRESLEMMELEIIDRVKEVALKKLGILPGILDNRKWIDNSLIVAFLKREQTNVVINNHPAPMEIKGMTPDILAALASPEKREPDPTPAIELEGVPRSSLKSQESSAVEPIEPKPEMIQ